MQSKADESPAPMSPQPLEIPEPVPKKVGEMEIEKATENQGPSDVCKEQQSEPMELSKEAHSKESEDKELEEGELEEGEIEEDELEKKELEDGELEEGELEEGKVKQFF